MYAWITSSADFNQAVSSVIALGRDTDTVAAITGALCEATTSVEDIPSTWISGFKDWPRGRPYIKRVATALTKNAEDTQSTPVRCASLAIPLRNLVFLIHGVVRYIPGGLRLAPTK